VTGRADAWTAERIRHALSVFLAGRSEWPAYAEFVRAGRKGLRDAVTRTGGARRWAAELSVEYVERKPGYAARWTEERVRGELSRFLAGRDAWPSRREFEAAGRKPLRDAVGRLGGIERWAAEFGLPVTSLRAGSRRRWDDERIEEAVRPLVERLGRWPTRSEFRAAGLSSALTAMYHRSDYGGIEGWRRHFGVPAPGPPRPMPDPTVWTDERIERELRDFCAGRTTWPGARAFEEAGLGRLYRVASLRGGVARWRALVGLDEVSGASAGGRRR
jgi:hypothetical protein